MPEQPLQITSTTRRAIRWAFIICSSKKTQISVWSFKPQEHHIYGSSRLGLQTYLHHNNPRDSFRRTGNKNYELINLLGNELSVASDRKIIDRKIKLLKVDTFDGFDNQLNFKYGNISDKKVEQYLEKEKERQIFCTTIIGRRAN